MISPFYDYKTGFSQTYFLSRVVKDAKSSPKISFFIRKNGLDTLRWTEPIAPILQIASASQSSLSSMLAATVTDPAHRSDQQSDQLCNKCYFLPLGAHES